MPRIVQNKKNGAQKGIAQNKKSSAKVAADVLAGGGHRCRQMEAAPEASTGGLYHDLLLNIHVNIYKYLYISIKR